MRTPTYDNEVTALLVVDPYNDFISEGARFLSAPRHGSVEASRDDETSDD
ncbi:MAG: hypothetical protein WAK55_20000 [Xanthobacteraceae bacterium]